MPDPRNKTKNPQIGDSEPIEEGRSQAYKAVSEIAVKTHFEVGKVLSEQPGIDQEKKAAHPMDRLTSDIAGRRLGVLPSFHVADHLTCALGCGRIALLDRLYVPLVHAYRVF